MVFLLVIFSFYVLPIVASLQWTWVSGNNPVPISSSLPVYGTQGIPSSSNNPGARSSCVSWLDSSGDFWLFGGTVATVYNGNFWISGDVSTSTALSKLKY